MSKQDLSLSFEMTDWIVYHQTHVISSANEKSCYFLQIRLYAGSIRISYYRLR